MREQAEIAKRFDFIENDIVKAGEAHSTLIRIIKGYAWNIRAYEYKKTEKAYEPAEICFPLDLLQSIHEEGDFLHSFDPEYGFEALAEYGIPKNFYLRELMKYIWGGYGTKAIHNWKLEEIKSVEIANRCVKIEVMLKHPRLDIVW